MKRKLTREKKAYNEKEQKEEDADSDGIASDSESLNLSPDESDDEVLKASKARADLQKQLGDLTENLSDDDAPDEISNVVSKKNALDKLREARAQIAQEKLNQKEVRRKRDLIRQEEKKLKLSKKVTKESDSDSDNEDLNLADDSVILPKGKHVRFSDNEDENESVEEKDDDFISLTAAGGIKPVHVKEVGRATSDIDRALAFRDKQLYGDRIKRETMSQKNSRAEKRRARRAK